MKAEQSQHPAEAALSLRVVEVDALSDKRWEELIPTLPQGLIYHHPGWLEVLEEAYGYKSINLACEDASGQLRGILPLVATHGLLSGRRLSSLPRTPVAGPLACDEQVRTALVRAAVERARDLSGGQLQLKVMTNDLDGLVEDVVGAPWRKTYVLRMPERPDRLRFGNSRNHTQIKWGVNKAAKQGVQISLAETEQELRSWYELYLDTMRWVVVPPRPYRFFEVAWKRLHARGMMRLLLARHGEAGSSKIVAGILLFMFNQTVFYAFSGWSRKDQVLRANDALQWRAIHDACADGFRYYDFGEVSTNNAGLAEFKSRWGTEPQFLYRYYYPAPREVEIGMLDADGPVHRLGSAIWRKLPIKATVLLSEGAHRLF